MCENEAEDVTKHRRTPSLLKVLDENALDDDNAHPLQFMAQELNNAEGVVSPHVDMQNQPIEQWTQPEFMAGGLGWYLHNGKLFFLPGHRVDITQVYDQLSAMGYVKDEALEYWIPNCVPRGAPDGEVITKAIQNNRLDWLEKERLRKMFHQMKRRERPWPTTGEVQFRRTMSQIQFEDGCIEEGQLRISMSRSMSLRQWTEDDHLQRYL